MNGYKAGTLIKSATDDACVGRVVSVRAPGIGERHDMYDVQWQDGKTAIYNKAALCGIDRDEYDWAVEFYRDDDSEFTEHYYPVETPFTLVHS